MSTLVSPVPTIPGRIVVPLRTGLWRVTNEIGGVLGYIEREPDAGGDRFSARRLVFATRTIGLGVFCRIEDAADCFR